MNANYSLYRNIYKVIIVFMLALSSSCQNQVQTRMGIYDLGPCKLDGDLYSLLIYAEWKETKNIDIGPLLIVPIGITAGYIKNFESGFYEIILADNVNNKHLIKKGIWVVTGTNNLEVLSSKNCPSSLICCRQTESVPLRQSESVPPLGWLRTYDIVKGGASVSFFSSPTQPP